MTPAPIVLCAPSGHRVVRCPCGREAAALTDPPLCGTCFFPSPRDCEDPGDIFATINRLAGRRE